MKDFIIMLFVSSNFSISAKILARIVLDFLYVKKVSKYYEKTKRPPTESRGLRLKPPEALPAEQAAEKLALNFFLAGLFPRLGFAWVCVVLAEMR
ncbi:MAG: hypothetical protein ACYCOU_08575, partial [Sulfobacillus sp.]